MYNTLKNIHRKQKRELQRFICIFIVKEDKFPGCYLRHKKQADFLQEYRKTLQ